MPESIPLRILKATKDKNYDQLNGYCYCWFQGIITFNNAYQVDIWFAERNLRYYKMNMRKIHEASLKTAEVNKGRKLNLSQIQRISCGKKNQIITIFGKPSLIIIPVIKRIMELGNICGIAYGNPSLWSFFSFKELIYDSSFMISYRREILRRPVLSQRNV